MFRKHKDKIIDRMPRSFFKNLANLYYTVNFFKKEPVKIQRYRDCWLVTKFERDTGEGVSLLSPTPKFLGLLTLKGFGNRFEKFFKIEERDTVLDVGACIGDTTVPMAIKAGNEGTTIAVEPEPSNVRFLKANTSRLNNVWIVEKAAWNHKEILRFNVHSTPTGHSIVDKFKDYIEVQADTLDNIVKNWDKIDFAKMDVQGAELQVLEGAKEMLKKTRKIVVETHYFGEKALYPKVCNFLKAEGFTVRVTRDRVVHAWE